MRLALSCQLILVSIFSLSCNQPFQPEVQYTPKLNVYSILFADSKEVYVRVMSVTESQSDVSEPVHGATVELSTFVDTTMQSIILIDTTAVIEGDTASFYYAPVHINPGFYYSLSVSKEGYPTVYSYVGIPFGYTTIPNQGTYSILRNPRGAKSNISFNVTFSGLAVAGFVQMLVEYRGLDNDGHILSGAFNVFPVDSLNPFNEITALTVPMTVDTTQYMNAYNLAGQYASAMRVSHMYVDIIVTQVDNNLYRYFVTSTRNLDPLQMRTDKIIFSNNYNGAGIVAGASVDTTRIFLY